MLYTGHKIKSGWLAFVARMARVCGSHDSHGSRLWLAWLALVARMTRMARACGSHDSLARTMALLNVVEVDFCSSLYCITKHLMPVPSGNS